MDLRLPPQIQRETMDRRLLLLPVALGLAVGLAWQLGFLGPKAGGSEDGPVVEADGPSLAGAPSEAGAPGTAEALALARGGTKPVAKTKAPTVDGPRVTGHVTDRAGKPVPDAHVLSIPDSTIKYFLAKDLGTPGCPAADAVTDEKGAFVVAVGKDAPAHAIVVEAASFGTAMESGVQAGADVTIVLDASATIHGTVTGSDGTAVVGAKVRVVGSFDAYRVELEAVSGPGGAYRLEGLPAAKKDRLGANPYAPTFSSVVEVTAETFAPLLTTGVGGLEPGKDKLRDFVLVHGAVVAGTVVDAETAAPIEGARVVLYSNEADNQGVSTARSGGTYLPNVISPRTLAETMSAKDGTFRSSTSRPRASTPRSRRTGAARGRRSAPWWRGRTGTARRATTWGSRRTAPGRSRRSSCGPPRSWWGGWCSRTASPRRRSPSTATTSRGRRTCPRRSSRARRAPTSPTSVPTDATASRAWRPLTGRRPTSS